MPLDDFKKYTQDKNKHSESKMKRSRSMLKLLESEEFCSIEDIERFIDAIEVELQHEEISTIFNSKFGTVYAHTTARDLFSCLKLMIIDFNALPENTNEVRLDNKSAINAAQVITLAEELNKNIKNPKINQHLKDEISKSILNAMKNIIETLI